MWLAQNHWVSIKDGLTRHHTLWLACLSPELCIVSHCLLILNIAFSFSSNLLVSQILPETPIVFWTGLGLKSSMFEPSDNPEPFFLNCNFSGFTVCTSDVCIFILVYFREVFSFHTHAHFWCVHFHTGLFYEVFSFHTRALHRVLIFFLLSLYYSSLHLHHGFLRPFICRPDLIFSHAYAAHYCFSRRLV